MESVDLIIKNASELLTLSGPSRPRKKNEMQNLSIIPNGSVAIHNQKIVAVGKTIAYRTDHEIDATGKVVMPGFVDPHTHLVFAGSREFELDQKLKGLSYIEILKQGGGIYYTVDKTRDASTSSLKESALQRMDTMISHGTTTCEAKTGYGLNTKTELRLLQIQKELNTQHPIDIISTFLGAHAIPKEHTADEYTNLVIKDMLPKIKNLATFCDVFCEKDVFTLNQSEQILKAGKKYGLIPKIHAEEIENTGGATLAANIGAISADHLLKISPQGISDMGKAGVIGVLLPATPFSSMMNASAPAQKIMQGNIPVALATDLNPNCWTENMQFIIQLACLKMKMTPAEALSAATYNAACAIQKQNRVGSIEAGKQADIIVMDCKNHMMIPYHFGKNHVETVVKNGKIVCKKE